MAEKFASGNVNVAVLREVFKKYGGESPEFEDQVRRFISFLMYRYMGCYDEDCHNDCYLRLLESFSYYNPTRCNIGSWVYTVVRNRVSSFLYWKQKILRESGTLSETMVAEGEGGLSQEVLDGDEWTAALRGFLLVKIVPIDPAGNLDELVHCCGGDHPLNRRVLWEKQLCRNRDLRSKRRRAKKLIAIQWT